MLLNKISDLQIPIVDVIQSFDDVKDLIAFTRELKDAEGFVVSFSNGHKIKVKADHYVRIHKTKDLIRTDRNIADIIVNE